MLWWILLHKVNWYKGGNYHHCFLVIQNVIVETKAWIDLHIRVIFCHVGLIRFPSSVMNLCNLCEQCMTVSNIVLLIVILLSKHSHERSDLTFVAHYNERLDVDSVKLLTVFSFQLCIAECFHFGNCQGINYDRVHLICYFLDVNHTAATLTSDTDYNYAYITSKVSTCMNAYEYAISNNCK